MKGNKPSLELGFIILKAQVLLSRIKNVGFTFCDSIFLYDYAGKGLSDGNTSLPKKLGASVSSSSSSSSTSLLVGKSRTVNVICVDSRARNQLPSTYLNDDAMKKDGNYYSDVEFELMDELSFNNFLKLNVTFGEMFTKNYYMYSLPRPHSKDLSPMPYHKHNYPNVSAREAICRGRLLVVSPVARSNEEMKLYYSSIIIDGVIILDDESSDRSPREVAYDDDEDEDYYNSSTYLGVSSSKSHPRSSYEDIERPPKRSRHNCSDDESVEDSSKDQKLTTAILPRITISRDTSHPMKAAAIMEAVTSIHLPSPVLQLLLLCLNHLPVAAYLPINDIHRRRRRGEDRPKE